MVDFKVGDRVRYWNLVSGKPCDGTVWRVDDDPDYPVVVETDGVKWRLRRRSDELERVDEEVSK